jgi:hypothetical protein
VVTTKLSSYHPRTRGEETISQLEMTPQASFLIYLSENKITTEDAARGGDTCGNVGTGVRRKWQDLQNGSRKPPLRMPFEPILSLPRCFP